MFGFLNVYKQKGSTSHDVVAFLRRVTKIKQIGHTGTLDPFAEGVLPICIGKSTRLIEYLADDKAYIGTVQLGASTTTYDNEGEIIKSSEMKVTKDDVESALAYFRGEIEQIPPIYSAIKVNGKKLYQYARNGEEVKIEPRKVNIQKLELMKFDSDKMQAELKIECSKGTYIRSIANDLGEKLGTYGHLIKLTRTKAGKFSVEDSVKQEELQAIEQVTAHLIYPLDYLDYPKYELSDKEYEKVSHGMGFECRLNLSDGVVILVKEGKLIAAAEHNSGMIKCSKVFI